MARADVRENGSEKGKRKPLTVDEHVGTRLKLHRTLAGMSQTELGKAVGVTFQQVQKYENGRNRVSAGHLYGFAQALDCAPADFFVGLDHKGMSRVQQINEALRSDEILQLFKAYEALDDQARRAVLEFARSLAE
jgi:transcriptional regulator with XRE-family HTH domain